MTERKKDPVYIHNDLARLLKAQAALEGTTMQNLTERALASYLLGQPSPTRSISAVEGTIKLMKRIGVDNPENSDTVLEIELLNQTLQEKYFPKFPF